MRATICLYRWLYAESVYLLCSLIYHTSSLRLCHQDFFVLASPVLLWVHIWYLFVSNQFSALPKTRLYKLQMTIQPIIWSLEYIEMWKNIFFHTTKVKTCNGHTKNNPLRILGIFFRKLYPPRTTSTQNIFYIIDQIALFKSIDVLCWNIPILFTVLVQSVVMDWIYCQLRFAIYCFSDNECIDFKVIYLFLI